MATLEIKGLRKAFGGVVALASVDVTIQSDEILGVIGPNGSGKTTLFNTVCGVYRPSAGTIHWNGVDIAGKPAYLIGRLGLGRTFQQAMSFPALTVRENVQIAIEHGSRREDGAGPRWSSPEELLEFVGLEAFADEVTSVMPFGNLRRLGVAVALGGRPAQLLLDEPAAGLNEGESVQLIHLLRRAHELGVGICIIDHHVGLMAELCERLVVLHFGNKIADGPVRRSAERSEGDRGVSGERGVSLLDVEDVWTAYGPIVVNCGVSIEVDEGEIVTIIGSNGAGKSTLLKTIAGLMRPKSGTIRLSNENVTGIYADGIARRGAVLVPEGRRIFPDLTVRDNLRLGGYSRADSDGVESDIAAMESFFPILAEKRDAKGSALSGGQQQMLAIARGLMAKPKILILDEPSLGLAPIIVHEVRSIILSVRDRVRRGGTARGAERGLGACRRRSRLHHAEWAHCRRRRDRRAAKPRPGSRDLSRQPSGTAAFAWRRGKARIMTATRPMGRSRRMAADGVRDQDSWPRAQPPLAGRAKSSRHRCRSFAPGIRGSLAASPN